MATSTKAMARGAFATTSATLYTVPAATTAVVSNIAVTNTSGNTATFNISLAGVVIQGNTPVPPNSTIYIDLKQVLNTTTTITGFASATSVNYHISGVEIA